MDSSGRKVFRHSVSQATLSLCIVFFEFVRRRFRRRLRFDSTRGANQSKIRVMMTIFTNKSMWRFVEDDDGLDFLDSMVILG